MNIIDPHLVSYLLHDKSGLRKSAQNAHVCILLIRRTSNRINNEDQYTVERIEPIRLICFIGSLIRSKLTFCFRFNNCAEP